MTYAPKLQRGTLGTSPRWRCDNLRSSKTRPANRCHSGCFRWTVGRERGLRSHVSSLGCFPMGKTRIACDFRHFPVACWPHFAGRTLHPPTETCCCELQTDEGENIGGWSTNPGEHECRQSLQSGAFRLIYGMFMPEFDWSTIGKEQEQEKVNGCAARRINAQTKEIDVDSLCPDKLFSPKYVDDATANGITVPIETQRMPQLRECRHPDPKLIGSFLGAFRC